VIRGIFSVMNVMIMFMIQLSKRSSGQNVLSSGNGKEMLKMFLWLMGL
jgi:hypothetical protein